MERISLTIDGMTCEHCVRAVDQALRTLPGTRVDRVEIGSAAVAYDPAAANPERIREVIAEEGYEVRAMERAE